MSQRRLIGGRERHHAVHALAAYEQLRQANIARNKAAMVALGLEEAGAAIKPLKAAPAAKKQKIVKSPQAKHRPVAVGAWRVRLRG